MRGKDTNDRCMVPCLCLIKDSSIAYVVVKVRVRQSPDIPLGFFEQSSKSCNVSNQLELPLCVLTLLGTLLSNINFFYFSMACYQVWFSTKQMGFYIKSIFSCE